MWDLLNAAEPFIVTALAAAFAWLGALLLNAARQYLGASAQVYLRRILADAIQRGLTSALEVNSQNPVQDTVNYIERTIPDTIAKLGATHGQLIERVIADKRVNSMLGGGTRE